MSNHSVEVKELKIVSRSDYKVVLGFAGAGFIGNTATMFIARSKGFKQVAWVKSNQIPPMTLITNGVTIQPFRIYLDESEKLLFVITESLIPAEGCWSIAEALFKWLQSKGVQEIYSLDGLPFSAVSTEVKALTYSFKIDLSKYGYPILKEGALSGINSCILEECLEKDRPYACIFIPTNKLTSIDYTASADAVDVLNKIFKFGVDSSPLRVLDGTQKKMAEQRSGIGNLFKKG